MGHSLSHAAVRGIQSTAPFATEEQELLAAGDIAGLIALKHSIFGDATMKEKEDDDTDDDTDDDDAEDGDDDDSDDDGDDDDDDDDDELAVAKRRNQELAAENKKVRQKAVARRKRVLELEAENERLRKGGKPKQQKQEKDEDDDESDSEDSELKKENEELKTRLVRQQLRSEFTDLTTGSKAIASFINPKAAFRLLDLDEVEIDEDGDIDGLEDAIKDLAKEHPYLLKKDDGDDEDEDQDRPRRTGQPPRRRKKSTAAVDREKLVKKYPSLAR